jgi:hypothetical protein
MVRVAIAHRRPETLRDGRSLLAVGMVGATRARCPAGAFRSRWCVFSRPAPNLLPNICSLLPPCLRETAMSATNDIFGAKPLESFFPSLAALPVVQTALRDEFGKDGSAIIAKMKAGESLSDEKLGAHDIILDLVHNNSDVADSLAGWSSAYDDTFPINVMQFGSVFWIEAEEFDDIGYFDTLEEAKGAATFNYEPFITEASKHED